MDTLNLSVPPQHDYSDPTVELEPARLHIWLSDLPLMNVVETVRLVSGALTALNEQKLEAEARFRCLEVYRPTVLRLFETVDPLHIRQLSMARSRRHETTAAAAGLFDSLASGYKLTVMDLFGQAVPLAGQALNRAIDALGCVLHDCFRYYRDVPSTLVNELHQLYRAARRQGLLDVALPGEEGQTGPTTATVYKFGMLLSLTDPGRLAEGEISLLADVLREHVDMCRVVQGGSWTGNGAGLFLLDLAGDALPQACMELSSPVTEGESYLLDTTTVVAALRERLAGIPERVRQFSPEAMVLEYLAPEERGARLRREQRHRDGRWVSLLLGLEGIHPYLLQVAGKQAVTATDTSSPMDCRVLDSSDRGMKLFVEEGGAGDARVGDLLGIIEGEAGQETLRLAGIRSLRVLEQGGLEAGVELIAGSAGAVNCSLPDQPESAPVPALFLPAEEESDIAATLVAERGLYEEGRALLIDVGGREIRVRAGRQVSDSPVFDRFEFAAE
ncbi:MAG: hypothetical protein WBO34_11490 [Gammaproteobacteria bacterium]